MQKVPILPTQPWQDGSAVYSTPTAAPATPSSRPQAITHASRSARLHLRHRPAVLLRAKTQAVARPRATVIHSAPQSLRRRLLGRPVPVFLRSTRYVTIPAVRIRLRPVERRDAIKRRHRALILRAGYRTLPAIRLVRLSPNRTRALRTLLSRRPAVILRSRGGTPGALVTAKTIGAILTRGRPLRGQALARVLRHRPLILRPPVTGVPRAKTIKGILVHPVRRGLSGKFRRHRPVVIRGPIIVRTPFGRIVLRPVERVDDVVRLRRRRLLLRAPGRGILRPVRTILLRPVERAYSGQLRRRRILLLRAPRGIFRRPTILLRPVERLVAGKMRRHRPVLLRPSRGITAGRTMKPIIVKARKNRRTRRLVHWLLKSQIGTSLVDTFFTEPFDPPAPTGITSSAIERTTMSSYGGGLFGSGAYSSPGEAGSYDYPAPLGKATSSPSEGAFDTPMPIGEVDVPDPET